MQTGGKATPGTDLAKNDNQIGANMPVAISASDNASSVTRSGISGGTVVITDDAEQQKRTGKTAEQTVATLNRDVSTDRDGSNALKPIFDEDEIRAGFEIVSAFSNEASTFLANKAREADSKREQAKAAQEKADNPNLPLNDVERLQLQIASRQLLSEASDISENWGAGGTYRQITTALIGAAGGNISAGNAAFVQGLVVNYVQQRGAGLIGDLVADGELTEGSPLHAALHGIVACAGAAASSQSCGSGAAGAAASSLLTGLFSQSSPDESEEQREAKRNLIVSLVTGLAANSASIDPTAANTAASAAVDNNWLATQQIVQYKKEWDEAKGLEKGAVFAKWTYISGRQDVLTQFGIGKGLASSAWGDVTGLAEFVANPIEGLNGLKQLINSKETRNEFRESVLNELNTKIDKIKTALEVGGDQNAEDMGKALGDIAWQVGSLVTGAGTVAKGGVQLAKLGIKASGEQLERLAQAARIEKLAAQRARDPNPMGWMGDHETTLTPERNVLEAKPKPEGRTLREVDVSSGEKGAWSRELNKPEPNTIYKVDGNKVYQTDELGRVDKVESSLSLNKNDRNTYQQCVAGKCGIDGDEGGNLIASIFNGPGERLNLLPMNGNLNKGQWK